MKRLLVLAVIAVAALQVKAQWDANYNVATFKDYDSTTFFLDVSPDRHWMTVDFPTVNTNDIVMFVGVPDADGTGVRNISWDGSTATPDSVILDKTVYTKKMRRSDGTRYSSTRVSLWWADGLPEKKIALTFVWNTAATGRIKVDFGQ